MKRKVKLIDKTGKNDIIIEDYIILRDKDHLQAQINFPSKTFKSKKGKGSYTRKSKHKQIF